MNSNRWFVAALVLLASCASVRERADADRRSVAADVQLRTGESATPEDLAAARAEYGKPSAHTTQVRAVFEQLRTGRKAAFLSPLHRASARRREREMAKP